MTGWRLGYRVWPQALYENARKLAVNCLSCTNAPDAICRHRRADRAAGRGARDGGGVRPAPPRGGGWAERPAGRDLRGAEGRFLRLSRTSPRTGWRAKPLASALLDEAGVATIGGPDFGVHGEGYIRLSYANSTENIREALRRMGEFLAQRRAA